MFATWDLNLLRRLAFEIIILVREVLESYCLINCPFLLNIVIFLPFFNLYWQINTFSLNFLSFSSLPSFIPSCVWTIIFGACPCWNFLKISSYLAFLFNSWLCWLYWTRNSFCILRVISIIQIDKAVKIDS